MQGTVKVEVYKFIKVSERAS